MRFGVKNVVKNIADGLFPPRCRGCGQREAYLCGCCKKYISGKMKVRELAGEEGAEVKVEEVFERAVYLGYRDEILGELIEEAKYGSVRGILPEIAEVAWRGYLEGEVSGAREGAWVLVPMPTSRKHVRERAMDHMDRICREIAGLSGGRVRRMRLLERRKDTVQVGASAEVRKRQAKEAVRVDERALAEFWREFPEGRGVKVVLMDDVWTTGASMMEAGKMLKGAGVAGLTAVAITKSRTRKSPAMRHGEID